MNAFETEIKTYNENLPSLKVDEGKFVLIHGKDVLGVFLSYGDAMTAGYTKLGIDTPFFVRKISAIEQVLCFSRDLECQA